MLGLRQQHLQMMIIKSNNQIKNTLKKILIIILKARSNNNKFMILDIILKKIRYKMLICNKKIFNNKAVNIFLAHKLQNTILNLSWIKIIITLIIKIISSLRIQLNNINKTRVEIT